MEYTYDAFISYRHLPADMAVAEKLQQLLESRKKKDGTKLTVFRDRSDLPTTSDLGADIRYALERSRFLIVICSPAYQYSKWCMTELQYFRQHHGTNGKILPILVEGEPEDVFPELLRYDTRTVWDEDGNPSTVWTEVEPLGADVRGKNNKERLKKLRVEYLRIAAPILGVSFDQLYQRAQRKKRAVTAAVIAALTAFAVYSIVLITQITLRQKKLEAKQQELYQNESIRLANEALDLVGENDALSMLLANAALPADLEKPDYPIVEESERAIGSAALQHQFAEASAYLTQKASIDLPVSRWTIGSFYDNGNYFSLIDYYETWLYEAHTGKLITVLPDYGYYFFDGINRYAQQIETTDEDGQQWLGCVIYDTHTGKELNRVEKAAPLGEGYLLTDHEGGKLWVLNQHNNPDAAVRLTYSAYGWFDSNGTYTETDTLPEYLDRYCQEQGAVGYLDNPYVYADGTAFGHYMYDECDEMPAAYQTAYRTFAEQFQSLSPYAFSPSADEQFAIIHFQNPEDFSFGAAFWSMEENRLLYASWDTYYLEKGSGLVYHQTDNRLEVLQINSENLCLPTNKPAYSYVSRDGQYGIALYNVYQPETTQYCVGVYRLSDPGMCKFQNDYGRWITGSDTRTPLFEAPIANDMIRATADCTRIAFLTPEEELQIVDIPSGQVIAKSDLSGKQICTLAINDSGSRVAYLAQYDDGFAFEVVDPDSLSLLGKCTWQWDNPDAYYYEPYMDLSEDQLLVYFSEFAFLYDLQDLTAEPQVLSFPNGLSGTSDICFADGFTDDGLLLLPAQDMAAQGLQRFINWIVDPDTGNLVEFQQRITYNRDDYYYDAVSGSLIQRNSNLFTIQRRGENGDFEMVCTIKPQHNDMELNAAGHASDGTWLVLQNEEYCEIYRMEDGALCYVLRKPDGRSSQLAVIDGRLYDFCLGGDSLGIPLPTAQNARDYIREALVYQGVTRTLTDQEMQAYYIPGSWQEK